MPDWRKKSSPPCPMCQLTSPQQKHRNCVLRGSLWIDLHSGTVQCDSCHVTWVIEDSTHYCVCGAIYQGGEIWYGMETELLQYAHLEWIQEIGICAGSMETRFLGWQQQHQRKRPTFQNVTLRQIPPAPKVNKQDDSSCVVATYVYGTPTDPKVDYLRGVRDNLLLKCYIGRLFVRAYYKVIGPAVKKLLSTMGHPARLLTRSFLNTAIYLIETGRKKG